VYCTAGNFSRTYCKFFESGINWKEHSHFPYNISTDSRIFVIGTYIYAGGYYSEVQCKYVTGCVGGIGAVGGGADNYYF
jgi:hypothetical protein